MKHDIYWTGIVSDVQVKSGTTQNGDPWKKTHFQLGIPKTGRNGAYLEKWYLDSFADITLDEGGVFLLGIDVRNEKQQDGKYALKLYANSAERIDAPQQGQQTAQRQPVNNGPENFKDDDIPF